ncbi:MAG: T9SS type A sorting domain-containing protein [Cyclobacteriaceae bacterium]|nr:T9SS type A sorting domain-containing protein [Cyclobacteriaceae bacterium]
MRFSTVLLIFGLLSAATVARAQESVSSAQESRPDVKAAVDTRQVTLYPNPAVETVTVKFEQAQTAKVRMTLHNIIGNVVEVESEILDDYEIRLKVKDLPAGYYLLAIRNDDSGFKGTFKILKR